jgi:hypothetical protein
MGCQVQGINSCSGGLAELTTDFGSSCLKRIFSQTLGTKQLKSGIATAKFLIASASQPEFRALQQVKKGNPRSAVGAVAWVFR